MKTIEEKAKAYDESIKKAMELWNSPRTCFDIEQLKSIFPELKDSEDERIRKSLIDFFGEQCDMSDVNGVYAYEVVAWLEKQKEQDDKELSEKIAAAYQLGRKDEKEQMMKEAVVYVAEPETPVGNILMPFIRIDHSVLFRYGIKVGDKVKLIIVKED